MTSYAERVGVTPLHLETVHQAAVTVVLQWVASPSRIRAAIATADPELARLLTALQISFRTPK